MIGILKTHVKSAPQSLYLKDVLSILSYNNFHHDVWHIGLPVSFLATNYGAVNTVFIKKFKGGTWCQVLLIWTHISMISALFDQVLLSMVDYISHFFCILHIYQQMKKHSLATFYNETRFLWSQQIPIDPQCIIVGCHQYVPLILLMLVSHLCDLCLEHICAKICIENTF